MNQRPPAPRLAPRGTIPAVFLWVPGLGILLTFLFWSNLWFGGGLIGGDLYTYFFPQKTFFVNQLRQGELPLWNTLAGHGYPLVAESQTGVFYPPHLMYLFLDANSAYNGVQILHYILAFIFCWMYARIIGLSNLGSIFAASVYTYSWFPARLCLEWAIIGGAWLPLALWSVESFLRSTHWRYLTLLSVSVALQILPGHFNLAFITLLVLVTYIPLRLIESPPLPEANHLSRKTTGLLLAIALVCSFGISAVQLLPTWELKQLSQRANVNVEHDPRYGSLPVWFFSQVVNPFLYGDPQLDHRLNTGLPPGVSTNKVEAHLYFGLLPFLLTLVGLSNGWWRTSRIAWIWVGLGCLALLYTPGWLIPITRNLPGFNFFKGPGRFGLVTTLAIAILSGLSLDGLRQRCRPIAGTLIAVCLLGLTLLDLWIVSGVVGYVTILPESTLRRLPQSPVRKLLLDYPQPVRLFSRGANLPTLLGVASTPEYLGIGPAEYYSPQTMMPRPLPYDDPPTQEQLDWLRRAGVTHLLSFNPLSPKNWPARYIWSGIDPFLNAAWGRREPLFLYELEGGRGRLAWEHPHAGDTASIQKYHANQVQAEVNSKTGGTLILTDLHYPDWNVSIDGKEASALVIDQMYRGVLVPAGKHTIVWSYEPSSVWIGANISLATLIFLAAIGHIRFWHPGLLRKFHQQPLAS